MTPMQRCEWVNMKNPLYIDYHDKEWGVPVHSDTIHFEFLILEGAQAGLSWETILNKRKGYKALFANFDPQQVAKFSNTKIQSILQNPAIVRNKLKVNSAVTNAKIFLEIQEEFGSFDKYIWAFVNYQPIQNKWENISDIPSSTKISDKVSNDLKKRGMKFVGSTIIYAYMQACGLVQDHTTSCFRYKELSTQN